MNGQGAMCRVLVKSGACLAQENKDGISIFNYQVSHFWIWKEKGKVFAQLWDTNAGQQKKNVTFAQVRQIILDVFNILDKSILLGEKDLVQRPFNKDKSQLFQPDSLSFCFYWIYLTDLRTLKGAIILLKNGRYDVWQLVNRQLIY